MAMEALVGIASRAKAKCLIAKTWPHKAFLEDTNEIVFNEEDMEVRHSDHRRPFYLAATITQIPFK